MPINLFDKKNVNPILQFCNTNMNYDIFTKEVFIEKTFDDPDYNKNLNFSFTKKGEILGFLTGVIRNTKHGKEGYIKLLVVKKEKRRQGIGRKLYKEAEDIFIKERIHKIHVYDVPSSYFTPGIDVRSVPAHFFVKKMGFRYSSETANMIVDLIHQNFQTYREEENLADKGIYISRADKFDKKSVLDFIDSNFPGWVYEVDKSFEVSPACLHMARHEGKIEAFSAYSCSNTATGWFGPMGTHKNLRNRGVGKILLKRCMNDLKEKGFSASIIPWIGPEAFYAESVNAKIHRRFLQYEKQLF